MVSSEFFIDISFRPHYGPGVDSASNRNENQECFLGVEAAGAYGWQPYHLHVPIVLKSGNLKLLETSGPVRACNGIALPLPLNKGLFELGTWGYYYFQLRTAAFKAYCATLVRRSNFRHQASPRVSPRKSTQRRKVELGEKCPVMLPKGRLPRHISGSFTCRKATTWDRRLYFPSEGRRGEDFFALKIRRLRPGANTANLGTKGHRSRWTWGYHRGFVENSGCLECEAVWMGLCLSTFTNPATQPHIPDDLKLTNMRFVIPVHHENTCTRFVNSVARSIQTRPGTKTSIFFHLAVCLTTGPKPLPKRALHIVRSRASSFKWEYPLLSLRSSSSFLRLLPCLPVPSIPPCIFPSVTRCRRQFRRKIWPIQFAFRLRISCRIFHCSLTLSNTSSFLTWSVQLIFSRNMSMKNSNDIIGNRNRDLPACSAVPQPTAPPRATLLRTLGK